MNLKTYVKGVNVVVDTLWGDSGKGKIVDMASAHVDMVVRYAGGANAGHTIKNDQGTFKLHLIPSGILIQGSQLLILELSKSRHRREELLVFEQGIKITNKNLLISPSPFSYAVASS